MEQTFTNNDLIRFIYKETSLFETLEIEHALTEDATLLEEYQSLMSGYMELPKATFAPSNQALQNILKYSTTNVVEA